MEKPDKAKPSILVVEDERHMREILKMLLESEGYAVSTADDGPAGVELLSREPFFNVVVTDIKMPGEDGFGILRKTMEVSPETLVIMITAFGTVESAIEAMKLGAYDYIHKPFKIDEIRLIVQKALEKQRLRKEISILKSRACLELDEIVSRSPQMKEVLRLLPRVAESRANVMITGESGTGKELIATAVHNLSERKDNAFVAINCASLPEGLLESELFGYMRGAFTGAVRNKEGLFESAHRGTLFLDEVAEMPVQLQSKLLRAIETGSFRRLGGTGDITVDVRIISATNRDVQESIASGSFREDLFYRLNAIPLHLPPLRERREDIPGLIEHFLKKRSAPKQFSKGAIDLLVSHCWKGNVRELENVIERILLFTEAGTVTEHEIPPEISGAATSNALMPEIGQGGIELEGFLENIEKSYLLQSLALTGGKKMEAAKRLGLTFRSFRHRLNKYGIK